MPEPQGRQQVQRCLVRAAVVRGDLDQQVLGARLGVLDEHVEVAVLVEDAGVEEFVLEVTAPTGLVGGLEVLVRELRLRVFVEVLHVRVRGRAVEVEVVLLDVLAVVSLGVGEAEHPLLEDRVAAVPQREREAQPLLVVADARDAVLAPAVGARACLVVGEVRPGVTAVAVVLPYGPPLALAQIGAPTAPGHPGFVGLGQPSPLGIRRVTARPHPVSSSWPGTFPKTPVSGARRQRIQGRSCGWPPLVHLRVRAER